MKKHLYTIAGAILAVISLGAEVKAGGTFLAASDAGITTYADDGEALDLPYTPSSSDFTFFHGPECTRDWGASSGQISFWGGGTADAYAVTPKLRLSQGKAYELSFSTRISRDGEANYKDLAVKIGLTPDADGLSETLWDETIMSTTSTNKKQIFSVASDGEYYIAFWCHGQTSTWDIYVNNIYLQEVDVTPKPVTGLSAEPAPNGELKVNITWTNPSETTVGETLDIIEKVEVLRGTDVIGTLENVDGGKEMSYEDTVDQAGKYTYSVIPYLGDKPGEAVDVTSSWVGYAVSITSVSNVVAEPVVNSTTSVSLTFDKPQAVEGYLDQADVAYKITRSTNGGNEETLESEWKGELPYVDNTITELGSYIYHVYTIYNGNTSYSGIASNAIVTGGYAQLPYSEDFTSTSSLSLFTLFHGPDGSRDWSRGSTALQYWGGPTADAYAVMPVFHFEAGKDYELKFDTRISSSTSSSNYKNLEVKIGQTPDVAGLDRTLWSETVTSGSYTTFKQIFSVENTGDYYIGFHCFGTANTNDLYVDNINLEEVVATPKAVTELTATPAPLGALKVSLSWVNPSETVTGETVDVVDKVEVLRGSDVIATLENLAGGSESTYEDTVESAGTYTYNVVPYLGQKAGEATKVTSAWVGKASSIPSVTDVVAEPVADNEKAVNLTFTQPEPTSGYMDPADVAYRITRSDNGATAITLEDAWQGEQPYVDNTIPELGSYVYNVYTIYNGHASFSSVASNAVVTGGCASLPYSQDFSGSQSGQLYTFFHGEDGTRDWSRNSSAALNYWGGTTADAYAVTPKFALESGKAYELTFDTRVSRASSPKNLAVKIGLTPTAEGLDEELWSETVENTFNNNIKQIFSVPATGEYYIAFHCFGPSNSDDLYVDNITLDEIEATPKPVTGLAATPAAEGVLKVTVSWTNPSESTAGESLDVIDKVEVLRGTEVIATLENLAGGAEASYEDTVDEAGTYTYSVVPYLGEEPGEAAEVTSAWVGYDTPKAPETVTAEETENGVVVTFDEVTAGVHDGYIDPARLVYIIKRNADTVSSDCTSSPYTDETTDFPLAMYTYSVAASDGENTSDFTAAPAIKLGDAIELPYTPDLSDEATRALFTISKNPTTELDQWQWNSSKEAMECTASNAVLITPPLNIQAGKIAVKWKATCWSARYEEDFEILLCKNDDPDNLEIVSTIATPHVDTVNWPSEVSSEATIYDAGKYYIAFRQETNNWSLYLYQADVEQLSVTTGIGSVTADNDAFTFDSESCTVTVPGAGHVTIHNLAGVAIVNTDTDGEAVATGNISAGIYVVTWTGENGEKSVVKIVIR